MNPVSNIMTVIDHKIIIYILRCLHWPHELYYLFAQPLNQRRNATVMPSMPADKEIRLGSSKWLWVLHVEVEDSFAKVFWVALCVVQSRAATDADLTGLLAYGFFCDGSMSLLGDFFLVQCCV